MVKGIYHQVASQIVQMIETGQAAPGTRLPSERDLAARFKVSRNTVREAIRGLVEKKILVCRRGAGSFVTTDAVRQIARMLKQEMAGQRMRLAEIFEVRRMLEPAIAARAAETIGPEALEELHKILDLQAAAMVSGEDPVPFDTRFHEILVEATGNAVLLSVFRTLTGVLAETRTVQAPGRTRLSLASHGAILSALKSGDPDLASGAMAVHMTDMEQLLTQTIKENELK